jgi:hypothetical protein
MRRLTTFAVRPTSVAVLMALILVVPAPARADRCVTPSGTIHSSAVSQTERTFSGDVSPFGPINGSLQILSVDQSGHFTGQFTINARGGTAYGTIDGQFTSFDPGGSPQTYMETLTFTGGTRRYAGIYGYASVSGTLYPDSTAVDTVDGGQICTH